VDENGKWVEHIATFWHAVERKKYGFDTIIKNCAAVWDKVSENDHLPTSFVEQLPEKASLQFKFAMQQNEMFILGMDEELYQDAMNNNNYAQLSKYLYRVQKLAKGDYYFRHHLETTVDDDSKISQQMGKMKRLSRKSLIENNPHKVHVSITGKITEI
jgi:CRISPR-associated endonuclease Csn1